MSEVTTIIEELKKVGALVPESETECAEGHERLTKSISGIGLLSATLLLHPDFETKDSSIDRIDNQRYVISKLEEGGFLPPRTIDTLEPNLANAIEAIRKDNYPLAVKELQNYGDTIEKYLPMWFAQCACVKKGDIIASIFEGIRQTEVDLPERPHLPPAIKASTWMNIIKLLEDAGVISPDEARKLTSIPTKW